jgi:hypothetical protein
MATLQATLTPTADPTPVAVSVSADEPSGAQWVARFLGSANVTSLASPFREAVTKFLDAVRAAGGTVHISATYRPPERAYLMHWSWKIVKTGYDPQQVPSYPGDVINIQWAHTSESGVFDQQASVQAARAMVNGYGISGLNVAPALNSRHTQKQAIDMNISWSGTLTINNASGTAVTISSDPKTGMNSELHTVGATYGVIKFVGGNSDKPHWSNDGH